MPEVSRELAEKVSHWTYKLNLNVDVCFKVIRTDTVLKYLQELIKNAERNKKDPAAKSCDKPATSMSTGSSQPQAADVLK